MQHRVPRHAAGGGRHRRTVALHSHRAPREPITEKGRYAVAAAVVAGIGVAAVSAPGGNGSAAGAAPRVSAAPLTSASADTFLNAALAAAASATPGPTNPTGTTTPGSTTAGSATTAAAATGLGATGSGATGSITAGSTSATGDDFAPSTGIAAVVPIGGIELGDDFVPQRRKERPLPEWVNPMPAGSVTSCFGERWGRLHAGVDLAAASGTPIVSVGAGVVVSAGEENGYGNAVLVDHGNGYLTHYAHMSVITATVGQHVAAGDKLGEEGSTGHSTGPHLHFEVHQGAYKNPIEPTAWMHEHGIDIPGCTTLAAS
ncbi:M23 family metallopeptidase [Actinoplanes sp. RD1]|uniref:M23 family metallopeptidase n=1 Tax=Actinoplanes sp. RD1 TaxID=3064538 RepID=UPI0027429787|nr:M23 family metallopeptidase [Actinoplanes sp. RD1]